MKRCFFLLLFGTFSLFASARETPLAVQGVLDLSQWDLAEDGNIPLHGEWSFRWKEWADPGRELFPRDTFDYISLPSYWNKSDGGKESLPGHGYATYQLKIILPEPGLKLSLNLKFILTSYTLFADGIKLHTNGKPGMSKETSSPNTRPQVVDIFPTGDTLLLTLHVSNYDLQEGGIFEDITLGEIGRIRQERESRLAFDLFIASGILVMAFYHIGIYLFIKDEKKSLYFSLFCFLMTLRGLVTGEMFLTQLFPAMPWGILLTLEYLTFYAGVPFFFLYLKNLYPDEQHVLVTRLFLIGTSFFVMVILFTSPSVFNKTLIIYQIITLFFCGYALFIMGKAVYKKKQSSRILLFGFLILFTAFLNDILHSNEIIHTGFITPVGLLAFIFSQAMLILNRNAKAYLTVEQQKDELLETHDLLVRSRQGTILGLAKLAEYRDENTGLHLERMREYCRIIASQLSQKEAYRGYITDRYLDDLYQSAILHDIGKVAVPDSVLLKKGQLDKKEFEQIKKHTLIGGDALLSIESQTQMKSFLTLGKEIAWFHHERWDGTGYPKGLKGKEIPLSARITAVADVYDALTSARPYKEAFSHEESISIIREGRGTHFDPYIVDTFLEAEDEILFFKKKIGLL